MLLKQVSVYFDGGSKASLYCILKNVGKNTRSVWFLKKLKYWAPSRHYKQAVSVVSAILRWLVGVARARLEEIDQIGLKPALVVQVHYGWNITDPYLAWNFLKYVVGARGNVQRRCIKSCVIVNESFCSAKNWGFGDIWK